jgi:hypothetical protein
MMDGAPAVSDKTPVQRSDELDDGFFVLAKLGATRTISC